MFLFLNWSTARIAHCRVWELFSLRHPEPYLAQWRIQAGRSTGKCQNESCAVWPTSKGQGISGTCLHHMVGIPGATWWMSYEQMRWGPSSSPLHESQLLYRSCFPDRGLGAIAEVMHKELLSLILFGCSLMTSSNWMIHSDFLKNLVEQEVRSDLGVYGNTYIEWTAKWTVLTALLFPLLSNLTIAWSRVRYWCSLHLLENEWEV